MLTLDEHGAIKTTFGSQLQFTVVAPLAYDGTTLEISGSGASAGDVLAWDGVAWTPTASPTGGGTATQVAYWSTATALAGDAGMIYSASGNKLTLAGGTLGALLLGSSQSSGADAVFESSGSMTVPTVGVIAASGLFDSILTAHANFDGLRGVMIYPVYAKSTFTGLHVTGFWVSAQAPTGSGTITDYATVTIVEATIATANIGILIGGHPGGSTNHAFFVNSSNAVYLGTGQVGIGATPATGTLLTITQAAATGVPHVMTVTGGTHTALTTTAEVIDINFNLARTVTWENGAIATQRFVVFQAPTIAFASGSNTVTNAATLAITDAPATGANAIITNAYALWVQAGKTLFGAATASAGIVHGVEINIGATTSAGVDASGLSVTATITAGANNQVIRGMLFQPLYAKGTATGIIAQGVLITAQTPTGSGTIVSYAGVQILEQTIATANIGMLVGGHPGGVINYAAYLNSANLVYLGTGDTTIGGALHVNGNKFSTTFHVLLANGIAQIADAANVTRLVILVDVSNGDSAIYVLEGGSAATAEIADPNNGYSITAGAANQINIYWTGARYEIQNKFAATHNIHTYVFGGV